jgi:DNA-binding NtrC family response regulator
MEQDQRPSRVLVVDDESAVATVLAKMAESAGYETVTAGSVEDAMERFGETPIDVVLADVKLGKSNGMELLRLVQERAADVPVVLITGEATIDDAMAAIRAGAYDYVSKPPRMDAIGALLRRAIEKKRMSEEVRLLQREITSKYSINNIAGRSPRMLDVFKTVARIAPGRANVLILGESGTGKELVARALHHQSPRAPKRFVPVNVSAIPENLLESELFGHVRGAFTGATASRRGLFEEAHQGTLFLDEIGDLSLGLQAKLLRVLQEHKIKPVGGNEEIDVDVRLVAATHRDLDEMVRTEQFREDLYFRINVVSISLPPLRDRPEDIPVLVEHFLHKYEHETGLHAPRCTPEALQRLVAYRWPGNVRELENVIERAMLLSPQGMITPESLPPRFMAGPEGPAVLPAGSESEFENLDDHIERYVMRVLEHTGGNRSRAAEILGISRRTLHRMAERKRSAEESERDNVSPPAKD